MTTDAQAANRLRVTGGARPRHRRRVTYTGLAVLLVTVTSAVPGHAGVHRWTPVGVEGGRVGLVVPQPGAPGTVWATVDGQLFRTIDGGATWAPRSTGLPLPPASDEIRGIAFDPSQPGTAVAATRSGVFRTTDAGATWARELFWQEVGTSPYVASDPFAPGTFYVLPGGAGLLRVLKSVDHGDTWMPIGSPPGTTSFDVTFGFALDPNGAGTFYVPMFRAGAWHFVVSTDFGTTWQVRGAGLPAQYGAFLVAPTNPTTLYLFAGAGLHRSTDAGSTFSQAGLGRTDVRPLAVDPSDPSVVYAVESSTFTPLALIRTPDDGGTWAAIPVHTPGLPQAYVSGLAVDPFDATRLWVGTNAYGMLTSSDTGSTWAYTSRGLPRLHHACRLAPVVGTPILYTATGNALWKSTDGGLSWLPRTPEPSPTGPFPLAGRFALDPADPDVIYLATGDGIFKSDDAAVSWSPASAGLTDLRVATVAIDPVTPEVLYAATPAGLFRSLDGAGAWTLRNAALQASEIVVDPFLPTTLYLDGGTRTSADAGLTTVVPPLFAPYVFPPPGTFLVRRRRSVPVHRILLAREVLPRELPAVRRRGRVHRGPVHPSGHVHARPAPRLRLRERRRVQRWQRLHHGPLRQLRHGAHLRADPDRLRRRRFVHCRRVHGGGLHLHPALHRSPPRRGSAATHPSAGGLQARPPEP